MTGGAQTRLLVWQWGRHGGAPRFATQLVEGLAALPDVTVFLSLSTGAEILRDEAPPRCDLLVETYDTLAGWFRRILTAPFAVPELVRRIGELRPDIAICAQPGPLDLLMATALRRLNIPFVVLVHDADAHPGDGFPCKCGCSDCCAVARARSHPSRGTSAIGCWRRNAPEPPAGR